MRQFRIVPLGKQDRTGFSSGSDDLDIYFRERVSQDVRRRLASCFIALGEDDIIAGFFTLSATSLQLDGLPPAIGQKLPRYPNFPAVLLGRLGISVKFQGQGRGGLLVADAIKRAQHSEVMAFALLVDAKDELAARFYDHMGFERLSNPLRLMRRL